MRCHITDDAAVTAEIVSMRLFDLGAQAVAATEEGLLAGFATIASGEAAKHAILGEFSDVVSTIDVEADDAAWVQQQRPHIAISTVPPFVLRPPWVSPPDGLQLDHDLVIDPGAAFGHGGHPSTQLALSLLIPRVELSQRIIDVGTGTGVLAIAAARLGATVTAIDIDPLAVAQAERNIGANDHDGIGQRIDVLRAELSDIEVSVTDLLVANVTLGTQRMIAAHARQSHRVILARILGSQISEVRDLYPAHEAITIEADGEWAAVEFLSDSLLAEGNRE